MKLMIIYWVMVVFVIVFYIITYFKEGKLTDKRGDFGMIIMLIAFSFLIIGIATNDPLFESIGLPKEYEWVGGLFSAGLLSWLYYFRPLKNRVSTLEVNTGKIEEKVKSIDNNVEWIKNSCKITLKK